MKNREFHTATMILLSALWLASCGGNQGSSPGVAGIGAFDNQLFSSLGMPVLDTGVEKRT